MVHNFDLPCLSNTACEAQRWAPNQAHLLVLRFELASSSRINQRWVSWASKASPLFRGEKNVQVWLLNEEQKLERCSTQILAKECEASWRFRSSIDDDDDRHNENPKSSFWILLEKSSSFGSLRSWCTLQSEVRITHLKRIKGGTEIRANGQ